MDIYGLNEKNLQDSYNFIKKALGTISVENIAEQNKIFMSFDEKNLETMPASFLDAQWLKGGESWWQEIWFINCGR